VFNNSLKNEIERFVLGTAQLGMEYGAANRLGKPDLETACSMIKAAINMGVEEFDTAKIYGESESVLGYAFRKLGVQKDVKVCTKLSNDVLIAGADAIKNALRNSILLTGVDCLETVLLHDENILDQWDGRIGEMVQSCVCDGLVKKIGVSAYNPHKVMKALNIRNVTVVQVPASVVDRRCEYSGVFEAALDLKKDVYIRSIFHQGMIFMAPEELPSGRGYLKPVIQELRTLAAVNECSISDLAVHFVREKYPSSRVLFGAESVKQVESNILSWKGICSESLLRDLNDIAEGIDQNAVSLNN
jgi:aryl-alcohol dehydrogenase-like predicted oxidoreductase